jgi:sulfite exporter TauE/SafE/copper chaperone CopZ
MSSSHKQTISIKGMHCRSCELLVEEQLKSIDGITYVSVDQKRGQAEITWQGKEPSQKSIDRAVRAAGYEIGINGKTPFMKLTKIDLGDLGIAFLLLFGAYFFLRAFGWTSLSIGSPSSASGIAMPLLVGLTAGFSTCMALVGGLVLGISARHAEKHPEATSSQKFRPHLFFNLGRIFAYAFLGGVLGMIGSVFQLSSVMLGILSIIVGIVMLVLGLELVAIFPWIERWKMVLPKSVSRAAGFGAHQKEYSHRQAMMLGALTFFLPCGFTQAMQLYAMSSGSFWHGALAMGLFAIGTVPGLLSVGGVTSLVKGVFARRFFKFAGLAVIIFSLFNIQNGYRLTGWSVPSNPSRAPIVRASEPSVVTEDGVQVVRMTQTASGYSPNKFVVKKGIPVKWIIHATALYACSGGISMPAFNIRQNLKEGDNVFTFTPQEVGTIRFTCTMGMYPGMFTVVE